MATTTKRHNSNYAILWVIVFISLYNCAIRKHQLPPIGSKMIIKSIEPGGWDYKYYYLYTLDSTQRTLTFYMKVKPPHNKKVGDTINFNFN